MYFENKIDDKNRSILDLTNVDESYLNNPNFSYLATFLPMVNFDEELLKELLGKDSVNTNTKEYRQRLERARYWVENYGLDYQVKLLDNKNIEVYNSLNEEELSWLDKTVDILNNNYNTSDELQSALYAVVKDKEYEEKELKTRQKRYFQILYNLLLNENKGPKLGLFLMAIDKEKIISLLK